jgi:hypothetical protein
LTDEEVLELVRTLRIIGERDSESLDLQLALAARPGPARDRSRAEILLEQRPSSLALGLLRRGSPTPGDLYSVGPLLRAARFGAGQFRVATEEWLADAPTVILDTERLPRDPHLRRVVDAVRALSSPATADELAELGEACLRAGWFREARAVAAALAVEDLDRALHLEDEAAACQQLLVELAHCIANVPESLARRALSRTDERADPPAASLDELLERMARHVANANAVIGGETDEQRIATALRASPRLDYAGLASIVHPGPAFSRQDERDGQGRAGELVPGLAQLFASLGRFALLGQMLGSEPDGTILSRLLIEEQRGEHLGVRWRGTLAWCEGADLRSLAGRMGAEISGAALHEGYWIDVDSVRRERANWLEFERRLFHGDDPERIERALATRGLELTAPASDRDARRAERRSADIVLGESDRVRLAVIAERRRSVADGPGITLDELLEATAVHEQGHLCDRARFLPISSNIWRAARLLMSEGFSPTGIARRLEYRAQLVALCEVEDPRIPLASVLRAAETGGNQVTAHAEAYGLLLVEFLEVLDELVERTPGDWPELDSTRVLAHQLHHLSRDDVRRVARELARSEGLFER